MSPALFYVPTLYFVYFFLQTSSLREALLRSVPDKLLYFPTYTLFVIILPLAVASNVILSSFILPNVVIKKMIFNLMKSTKTTFYFFHLIPNEVRIAFDLTELRLCKPRARLFSCRDSLLHVLVFIFFSMIPIAPEGHRWRVTRAPDTGAVQQDVYRPSCKI